MTRSAMRIHTSDTARAGEWRDIFGTDVLPVREVRRGTAPGVAEATFYVLDIEAFSHAVRRRAAEWVQRKWGHALAIEELLAEFTGEHGLPIMDHGDIQFGVDVRLVV